MEIDKSKIKVSFSFTPEEYFLCYEKDDRFPNGINADGSPLKVYTLNPRIDRSYAGKDDDVAIPVIYLSEEEAKQCRENGFIEII